MEYWNTGMMGLKEKDGHNYLSFHNQRFHYSTMPSFRAEGMNPLPLNAS
jgi:hypothetical protein